MTTALSPELRYTALSALLTGLIWVPYILNRMVEMGLWRALGNPEPDSHPEAKWAFRCMSAHRNAIENLVVFAPLAIIVHVLGLSNSLTAMAAAVYFASRVAHLVIYMLGIPFFRTIAFAVGFGCQMIMAYTILMAV
ncbi:MAG: MAPEG family protein [Alphaproteobacteria bacterium]|nr:MAPEG family protein [Alphaproteobacteria bacterium]